MEATGTALILLLAVVVSGYLARLAHLPAPLCNWRWAPA